MIWYIIILAVVMTISYYSKVNKIVYVGDDEFESSGISNIGFISIIIILILFEGLRSSTVGTDTGSYCRGFMYHTTQWWKLDFSNFNVIFEEPGLTIIYFISEIFTRDYLSFLLVASSIMVTSSLIGIRNASNNFKVSLFCYITLAFYLFGFAGIRQGLAISIFILSFKYIFVNNLKKYLLIVLIAALFHKSIIVALPMYYICSVKFNKRNILLIVIGSMIVGFSMNTLLNLGMTLEDRYEYYTSKTAQGSGSLLTLFSVCLTLFYIYMRNIISEYRIKYYDKALFFLIIGTSIYLVVTLTGSNTELNRFAFYFQTGAIFLLSEYVTAVSRNGNKQMLHFLIIVHVIYYITYVNFIGGIGNYKLNPILFL